MYQHPQFTVPPPGLVSQTAVPIASAPPHFQQQYHHQQNLPPPQPQQHYSTHPSQFFSLHLTTDSFPLSQSVFPPNALAHPTNIAGNITQHPPHSSTLLPVPHTLGEKNHSFEIATQKPYLNPASGPLDQAQLPSDVLYRIPIGSNFTQHPTLQLAIQQYLHESINANPNAQNPIRATKELIKHTPDLNFLSTSPHAIFSPQEQAQIAAATDAANPFSIKINPHLLSPQLALDHTTYAPLTTPYPLTSSPTQPSDQSHNEVQSAQPEVQSGPTQPSPFAPHDPSTPATSLPIALQPSSLAPPGLITTGSIAPNAAAPPSSIVPPATPQSLPLSRSDAETFDLINEFENFFKNKTFQALGARLTTDYFSIPTQLFQSSTSDEANRVLESLQGARLELIKMLAQFKKISGSKLVAAPLPKRSRTLHDGMLSEMEWAYVDMHHERRWKHLVAKQLALDAQNYRMQMSLISYLCSPTRPESYSLLYKQWTDSGNAWNLLALKKIIDLQTEAEQRKLVLTPIVQSMNQFWACVKYLIAHVSGEANDSWESDNVAAASSQPGVNKHNKRGRQTTDDSTLSDPKRSANYTTINGIAVVVDKWQETGNAAGSSPSASSSTTKLVTIDLDLSIQNSDINTMLLFENASFHHIDSLELALSHLTSLISSQLGQSYNPIIPITVQSFSYIKKTIIKALESKKVSKFASLFNLLPSPTSPSQNTLITREAPESSTISLNSPFYPWSTPSQSALTSTPATSASTTNANQLVALALDATSSTSQLPPLLTTLRASPLTNTSESNHLATLIYSLFTEQHLEKKKIFLPSTTTQKNSNLLTTGLSSFQTSYLEWVHYNYSKTKLTPIVTDHDAFSLRKIASNWLLSLLTSPTLGAQNGPMLVLCSELDLNNFKRTLEAISPTLSIFALNQATATSMLSTEGSTALFDLFSIYTRPTTPITFEPNKPSKNPHIPPPSSPTSFHIVLSTFPVAHQLVSCFQRINWECVVLDNLFHPVRPHSTSPITHIPSKSTLLLQSMPFHVTPYNFYDLMVVLLKHTPQHTSFLNISTLSAFFQQANLTQPLLSRGDSTTDQNDLSDVDSMTIKQKLVDVIKINNNVPKLLQSLTQVTFDSVPSFTDLTNNTQGALFALQHFLLVPRDNAPQNGHNDGKSNTIRFVQVDRPSADSNAVATATSSMTDSDDTSTSSPSISIAESFKDCRIRVEQAKYAKSVQNLENVVLSSLYNAPMAHIADQAAYYVQAALTSQYTPTASLFSKYRPFVEVVNEHGSSSEDVLSAATSEVVMQDIDHDDSIDRNSDVLFYDHTQNRSLFPFLTPSIANTGLNSKGGVGHIPRIFAELLNNTAISPSVQNIIVVDEESGDTVVETTLNRLKKPQLYNVFDPAYYPGYETVELNRKRCENHARSKLDAQSGDKQSSLDTIDDDSNEMNDSEGKNEKELQTEIPFDTSLVSNSLQLALLVNQTTALAPSYCDNRLAKSLTVAQLTSPFTLLPPTTYTTPSYPLQHSTEDDGDFNITAQRQLEAENAQIDAYFNDMIIPAANPTFSTTKNLTAEIDAFWSNLKANRQDLGDGSSSTNKGFENFQRDHNDMKFDQIYPAGLLRVVRSMIIGEPSPNAPATNKFASSSAFLQQLSLSPYLMPLAGIHPATSAKYVQFAGNHADYGNFVVDAAVPYKAFAPLTTLSPSFLNLVSLTTPTTANVNYQVQATLPSDVKAGKHAPTLQPKTPHPCPPSLILPPPSLSISFFCTTHTTKAIALHDGAILSVNPAIAAFHPATSPSSNASSKITAALNIISQFTTKSDGKRPTNTKSIGNTNQTNIAIFYNSASSLHDLRSQLSLNKINYLDIMTELNANSTQRAQIAQNLRNQIDALTFGQIYHGSNHFDTKVQTLTTLIQSYCATPFVQKQHCAVYLINVTDLNWIQQVAQELLLDELIMFDYSIFPHIQYSTISSLLHLTSSTLHHRSTAIHWLFAGFNRIETHLVYRQYYPLYQLLRSNNSLYNPDINFTPKAKLFIGQLVLAGINAANQVSSYRLSRTPQTTNTAFNPSDYRPAKPKPTDILHKISKLSIPYQHMLSQFKAYFYHVLSFCGSNGNNGQIGTSLKKSVHKSKIDSLYLNTPNSSLLLTHLSYPINIYTSLINLRGENEPQIPLSASFHQSRPSHLNPSPQSQHISTHRTKYLIKSPSLINTNSPLDLPPFLASILLHSGTLLSKTSPLSALDPTTNFSPASSISLTMKDGTARESADILQPQRKSRSQPLVDFLQVRNYALQYGLVRDWRADVSELDYFAHLMHHNERVQQAQRRTSDDARTTKSTISIEEIDLSETPSSSNLSTTPSSPRNGKVATCAQSVPSQPFSPRDDANSQAHSPFPHLQRDPSINTGTHAIPKTTQVNSPISIEHPSSSLFFPYVHQPLSLRSLHQIHTPSSTDPSQAQHETHFTNAELATSVYTRKGYKMTHLNLYPLQATLQNPTTSHPYYLSSGMLSNINHVSDGFYDPHDQYLAGHATHHHPTLNFENFDPPTSTSDDNQSQFSKLNDFHPPRCSGTEISILNEGFPLFSTNKSRQLLQTKSRVMIEPKHSVDPQHQPHQPHPQQLIQAMYDYHMATPSIFLKIKKYALPNSTNYTAQQTTLQPQAQIQYKDPSQQVNVNFHHWSLNSLITPSDIFLFSQILQLPLPFQFTVNKLLKHDLSMHLQIQRQLTDNSPPRPIDPERRNPIDIKPYAGTNVYHPLVFSEDVDLTPDEAKAFPYASSTASPPHNASLPIQHTRSDLAVHPRTINYFKPIPKKKYINYSLSSSFLFPSSNTPANRFIQHTNVLSTIYNYHHIIENVENHPQNFPLPFSKPLLSQAMANSAFAQLDGQAVDHFGLFSWCEEERQLDLYLNEGITPTIINLNNTRYPVAAPSYTAQDHLSLHTGSTKSFYTNKHKFAKYMNMYQRYASTHPHTIQNRRDIVSSVESMKVGVFEDASMASRGLGKIKHSSQIRHFSPLFTHFSPLGNHMTDQHIHWPTIRPTTLSTYQPRPKLMHFVKNIHKYSKLAVTATSPLFTQINKLYNLVTKQIRNELLVKPVQYKQRSLLSTLDTPRVMIGLLQQHNNFNSQNPYISLFTLYLNSQVSQSKFYSIHFNDKNYQSNQITRETGNQQQGSTNRLATILETNPSATSDTADSASNVTTRNNTAVTVPIQQIKTNLTSHQLQQFFASDPPTIHFSKYKPTHHLRGDHHPNKLSMHYPGNFSQPRVFHPSNILQINPPKPSAHTTPILPHRPPYYNFAPQPLNQLLQFLRRGGYSSGDYTTEGILSIVSFIHKPRHQPEHPIPIPHRYQLLENPQIGGTTFIMKPLDATPILSSFTTTSASAIALAQQQHNAQPQHQAGGVARAYDPTLDIYPTVQIIQPHEQGILSTNAVWRGEEDVLLLSLVRDYGFNFQLISDLMTLYTNAAKYRFKTRRQCSMRYNVLLFRHFFVNHHAPQNLPLLFDNQSLFNVTYSSHGPHIPFQPQRMSQHYVEILTHPENPHYPQQPLSAHFGLEQSVGAFSCVSRPSNPAPKSQYYSSFHDTAEVIKKRPNPNGIDSNANQLVQLPAPSTVNTMTDQPDPANPLLSDSSNPPPPQNIDDTQLPRPTVSLAPADPFKRPNVPINPIVKLSNTHIYYPVSAPQLSKQSVVTHSDAYQSLPVTVDACRMVINTFNAAQQLHIYLKRHCYPLPIQPTIHQQITKPIINPTPSYDSTSTLLIPIHTVTLQTPANTADPSNAKTKTTSTTIIIVPELINSISKELLATAHPSQAEWKKKLLNEYLPANSSSFNSQSTSSSSQSNQIALVDVIQRDHENKQAEFDTWLKGMRDKQNSTIQTSIKSIYDQPDYHTSLGAAVITATSTTTSNPASAPPQSGGSAAAAPSNHPSGQTTSPAMTDASNQAG